MTSQINDFSLRLKPAGTAMTSQIMFHEQQVWLEAMLSVRDIIHHRVNSSHRAIVKLGNGESFLLEYGTILEGIQLTVKDGTQQLYIIKPMKGWVPLCDNMGRATIQRLDGMMNQVSVANVAASSMNPNSQIGMTNK